MSRQAWSRPSFNEGLAWALPWAVVGVVLLCCLGGLIVGVFYAGREWG